MGTNELVRVSGSRDSQVSRPPTSPRSEIMSTDVLVAAASTGVAHVIDGRVGASLHTLKDCKPAARGLCAAAGVVLTAERSRSFVHAWTWRKEQPRYRCQVPERLTSLTCTADGAHCVGGGVSGKLYLWQVATGHLLLSWDAHFKPVTALACALCDGFLLSAGEDAMLLAWSFTQLLHAAHTRQSPTPYRTWAEHTLPISAICVASCGGHDLIASASTDQTVRLWRLSDDVRGCVHSAAFPVALTAVAIHPRHTCVYAGGTDGRLRLMPLLLEVETSVEARTRSGLSSSPHANAVQCVGLSTDGTRLFSCATAELGQPPAYQTYHQPCPPAPAPISRMPYRSPSPYPYPYPCARHSSVGATDTGAAAAAAADASGGQLHRHQPPRRSRRGRGGGRRSRGRRERVPPPRSAQEVCRCDLPTRRPPSIAALNCMPRPVARHDTTARPPSIRTCMYACMYAWHATEAAADARPPRARRVAGRSERAHPIPISIPIPSPAEPPVEGNELTQRVMGCVPCELVWGAGHGADDLGSLSSPSGWASGWDAAHELPLLMPLHAAGGHSVASPCASADASGSAGSEAEATARLLRQQLAQLQEVNRELYHMATDSTLGLTS